MKCKLVALILCIVTMNSVSGSTIHPFNGEVKRKISTLIQTFNERGSTYLDVSYGSQPSRSADLLIRLPFAGSGCNCQNRVCSCCAAIYVQAFDFDRKACAVMQYGDVVNFEVIVNQTYAPEPQTTQPTLAAQQNQASTGSTKTTFSPMQAESQQLCVPVAPFTRLGPVEFCVKMVDIGIVGKKIHSCIDMMAKVGDQPMPVNLKVNCFDVEVEPAKTNSVAFESNGPQLNNPVAN